MVETLPAARLQASWFSARQFLASFKAYVRSFIGFARGRLIIAYAIVLAAAALEGVGLLAILPVFELLSGTAQSSITSTLASFLQSLGLANLQGQMALFLVGFFALVILRNAMIWLRNIKLMALGQGYINHMQMMVMGALAHADWETTRKLELHQGLHAITNDVQRLSAGTTRLLSGLVTLITLFIQMAAAFVIAPELAVSVSFLLLTAIIVAPLAMKHANLLGKRRTGFGKRLFATLLNFSIMMKLAKVQRDEDLFLNEFEYHVVKLREEALQFSAQQTTLSAVFQILIAGVICLIVYLGAFVFELGIIQLTAILVILARLNGPLVNLLQDTQKVANLLPAFDHIENLRMQLEQSKPPKIQEKQINGSNKSPVGLAPASSGPVKLRLSMVGFRFEGQESWILDGLNWQVEPGEMVALTGPSGGGKTTLFDLMTGLLVPDRGTVTLDQLSVNEAQSARKIAYCSQDPVLLDRSIRENLNWANINVSDEAMFDALRLCGAEKFVLSFPDGLDSRVGDRGQSISGGERQRICLARALLRNPGLLVLDEATSAIDAQTEHEILLNLSQLRQKMTIIVATHRPIHKEHFDKLYLLREGKVEET